MFGLARDDVSSERTGEKEMGLNRASVRQRTGPKVLGKGWILTWECGLHVPESA